MASAARIVGFAHLLRTRSPHSPPAARGADGASRCDPRPGEPDPVRREQPRPGRASGHAVETAPQHRESPLAASTTTAQARNSQQLATPRTTIRSKPRRCELSMSRKPPFRRNSQHCEPRFAPNRDAASPRRRGERSSASPHFAANTTHCSPSLRSSRDTANSQRRGKHSPSDSIRQFAGSNALFSRSGMNFPLCSTC